MRKRPAVLGFISAVVKVMGLISKETLRWDITWIPKNATSYCIRNLRKLADKPIVGFTLNYSNSY